MRTVPALFKLLVLNLLLQVFDGVATYRGLQLGIREGNTLLAEAFQYWGIGVSLLGFKVFACGALIFVYAKATATVACKALGAIAAVYCTASLVPWLVAFGGIALHVW
jgi:hypothetical protein